MRFIRARTMLMLAAAVLGLSPASAQADAPQTTPAKNTEEQEEATEKLELEEVVVTATRRPTKLENAPAVVNVITEEEIGKLPWANVSELLENEVGIRTDQPQGMGSVTPQSITMRGISSTKRSLLMVDGQVWNSGFTDYFQFSEIPVEAIKRIEVVRGPFSALYGSNAMGGIIHIITKDGWGQKPQASGFARFGNFSRRETGETVGGSYGGKASFFTSHSTYHTDNYYLNDERDDIFDTRNREHRHDRFHLHGRAMLTDDLEMHLSGGRFTGRTGFGMAENLGFENEMDAESAYLNARCNWYASPTAEVFFGLDRLEQDRHYTGETLTSITFPPFPPPIPNFNYEPSINKSGFERTRAQVGMNLDLAPNNTLTVGAEYRWVHGFKEIVQRDTGQLLQVLNRAGSSLSEREGNYALYAQDDWWLVEDTLEMILGARYDHYEAFGGELSPKGSLIYHYSDDGRVKLSAGKAFRAPSFSSRQTPPWTMAPFLTYVGNPDLEPETSWSYELSLEKEFLEERLTTRVTPFLTQADDFITTATLADPLDPTGRSSLKQPQNIQEVEAKGVETEIGYRVSENLRLFLNHQYAEATDESTDEILDNHPRNTARLGATWTDRYFEDSVGLTASLIWRYTDSQKYTTFAPPRESGRIGGYTTCDARVAVDFWKRRITVFADVFNLFDKETFRTSTDDYLPERNWMVGAQVKFEF